LPIRIHGWGGRHHSGYCTVFSGYTSIVGATAQCGGNTITDRLADFNTTLFKADDIAPHIPLLITKFGTNDDISIQLNRADQQGKDDYYCAGRNFLCIPALRDLPNNNPNVPGYKSVSITACHGDSGSGVHVNRAGKNDILFGLINGANPMYPSHYDPTAGSLMVGYESCGIGGPNVMSEGVSFQNPEIYQWIIANTKGTIEPAEIIEPKVAFTSNWEFSYVTQKTPLTNDDRVIRWKSIMGENIHLEGGGLCPARRPPFTIFSY